MTQDKHRRTPLTRSAQSSQIHGGGRSNGGALRGGGAGVGRVVVPLVRQPGRVLGYSDTSDDQRSGGQPCCLTPLTMRREEQITLAGSENPLARPDRAYELNLSLVRKPRLGGDTGPQAPAGSSILALVAW